MLLLQRGHHRHHRFNKAGALWALRPKAPLAPEDPWPNGPLRGVVRGLHPFVTHECPQALPQLQDLPAAALCLGHPTGLARVQQPRHVAPDGPQIPGKGRVGQRPVADPMPPMEHLTGLRLQGSRRSLESAPHTPSWRRYHAASAPNRGAAARLDTRCRRSSDRSPTSPRSVPPRVPAPPCRGATTVPQRP
jgi:hypothetical protein